MLGRKNLEKELNILQSNYHIAEDMKLIAEEFKEKYPGIASDAIKLHNTYLAKARGE